MIPLKAHFDGQAIVLDEPASLQVGQKVYVYVDGTQGFPKHPSAQTLDQILKPVRDAFAASGMTDDELAELLEVEKHAMRGVAYESE